MKKFNPLMLIALVYILFSCREELQYTENFTPPKPHQDGIAKNINFSGFNEETGVSFSEASLSINKVITDKNGKSSLQDFDIDTTFIKKFTYQKTKNSYSLRAFKRGEDPSKGIYNIVYYHDGSIWKNDIYKLTYSSEFLQKYNANTLLPFAGTIEHIGTGYNKDSSQTKYADVYTCSWSTGQLCYCANHTPSQCSGCESGFRTVTTITCSPADGSGNGGTGSNTTIPPPSLGSPPFNDNPGGGNTNPIGDYEFYNNLPVFDDPRYLEYNWKYNLWNKLSSRLSFDPELYSKFEDFQVLTKGKRLADLEYLASFAEQKNKFTHWAINFLTQNSDVSWVQFKDWFLIEMLNEDLQNELFEDWANPNTVKPTAKFKNHAKLNGIYNKIKTASNFNQILKNFTPEGAVAHLIFDIGKTERPDAQAETREPENYWIKITFNQNKNWANIPIVVISGTFMHEIIHAEMLRQLLSVANLNGNEAFPFW